MHASADDLHAAASALCDVVLLDEPEATTAALELLARLIPCDFSAVTWLNAGTGEVLTQTCPRGAVPEQVRHDRNVVAQHPLAPHLAGPRPPALRISDVLDDRHWRVHPVRCAMAEIQGNAGGPLERQLGWGLATDSGLSGYATNRLGRDFSLRDRELLGLLAPG